MFLVLIFKAVIFDCWIQVFSWPPLFWGSCFKLPFMSLSNLAFRGLSIWGFLQPFAVNCSNGYSSHASKEKRLIPQWWAGGPVVNCRVHVTSDSLNSVLSIIVINFRGWLFLSLLGLVPVNALHVWLRPDQPTPKRCRASDVKAGAGLTH